MLFMGYNEKKRFSLARRRTLLPGVENAFFFIEKEDKL